MSYSSEVLADSPLAYYRFSEPFGATVLLDSSGNGRNGTFELGPESGVAGLLVDDPDTAIRFDGTDHAQVAYDTWMAQSNFTAECLFKPETTSGTRVLISRQQTGGSLWSLRQEGTTLKFYHWNTSGSLQAALTTATGAVALGTIYHAAITFESGVARRLYLNGVEVASQVAATVSIGATGAALRMGASGNGERFIGVIDEAAFYGSALSATRIAAHYTAATTAAPATGTLTGSTPAVAGDFLGNVEEPAADVSGTLAGTTPAVDADFAGTVPREAVLSGVTPAVTAALSGQAAGVVSGSLAGTTPRVVGAFVSDNYIRTDQRNFANGRSRTGYATVTVEPPVEPLPPTLVRGHDKVRAVAYTEPILVEGRPT